MNASHDYEPWHWEPVSQCHVEKQIAVANVTKWIKDETHSKIGSKMRSKRAGVGNTQNRSTSEDLLEDINSKSTTQPYE